jgi:hypothetical protein
VPGLNPGLDSGYSQLRGFSKSLHISGGIASLQGLYHNFKKGEYLKDKINEHATNSKNKTCIEE